MIYNLFISHSWTHGDIYDKLVNLLKSDSYFAFKNYSVPKNDPVHNAKNDKELRAAIKRQMAPASCVLILTGVYATYSKWINVEVELAKEMGKKIIAIDYWGAQRTSLFVKQNADVIVKWQTSSIIKEIRGW